VHSYNTATEKHALILQRRQNIHVSCCTSGL